jgi:endoglucanase
LAFVFAPDHISSYRYAMAAGTLARMLRQYRHDYLAELYARTALAAWNAAERGYADPDAFFVEAIKAAGPSGAEAWESKKASIQNAAAGVRFAAAAALHRLTGDAAYRSIVENAMSRPDFEASGVWADGLWDYLRAEPAAAGPLQEKARRALLQAAQFVTSSQAVTTYPTLKHFYAPMGWGQGNAPDIATTLALIRAHRLTGGTDIKRAMILGSHQILGMNQLGLSFTIGLGLRNVRHPLHEDHLAMGLPAPPGITIYGWSTKEQVDFNWLFGPFWAPLPEGSDPRENATLRQLEPNRWALPIYEFIVEHPLVIPQQEYTVHQTIGTTAALWLYLHTLQ